MVQTSNRVIVRYSIEAEPRGKADEIRMLPQPGMAVYLVGDTTLRVESVGTRRTVRAGRQPSVDEAWVRLERRRNIQGTDYITVPVVGCLKKVVQNLVKAT